MSAPPGSRASAPQPAQPPRNTAIADLLSQVGQGDQAAFEELYQCTAPQVFGLISLILDDASAAEEITVAAYQQVWHTAARYDPTRGSATAWVLGVARGRAVRHLRAHRKTAVPPATTAARELAPLSGISRPAGLEDLDESSRELILLVYYRGYSTAQAASLLGLPAETVAPRLHAALAQS